MLYCSRLLAWNWLLNSTETPASFLLLVVAIIVFGAVVFSLARAASLGAYSAERTKKIQTIAKQLGLDFQASGHYPNPDFEPFTYGGQRRVESTISGVVHGRLVQTGDFYYELYIKGKGGHTYYVEKHRFSYCSVKTPTAAFVELMIRPEGLFDKMEAVAGSEDINFESAEFSRKFHVSSLNRKFAYDVINPRTMELLLSHPTYQVLLNSTGILVTASLDYPWPIEEFSSAIQFAVAFLDQIPPHVWEEYKSQ